VGVLYTKATPPQPGSFRPTPTPGVISNPSGPCMCNYVLLSKASYINGLVLSGNVFGNSGCYRGSALPGSGINSGFG
jgi:hypothetical protein